MTRRLDSHLDKATAAAREILEKYGYRPTEDIDDEVEAAIATAIKGYIG